jgi:acyl-CoA thioesterase FadM
MPRVKLAEQPHYEFQHTLTVRVTDLNYGAHLANNAVVELVHEARARIFHALGFVDETNLGDGRTGIIMGDLVINFKQEGFMFDTLVIHSHFDEFSGRSFRLFHKITRDDLLLALVETGLVMFDYVNRKPVAIPPIFFERLKQFQDQTGQTEPVKP